MALAIPQIAKVLRTAWNAGLPVVACNATFDLTMLDHELWRCAHSYLKPGPVIDPLVLDRALEPYRKGSRKLDALAAHYGVKQEAAHEASQDALTAARVVWAQLKANPHLTAMTLDELTQWQRNAHEAWAVNFEKYLRGQGKQDVIDPAWPMKARAA